MSALEETLRGGLLAAMPLPVYVWTRGDDGELRLRGYNREASRWTHGAVAGFVGSSVAHMYPDEPEIAGELHACLAEQAVIRRGMVYRFRSTDEVRHLAVTYAPAGPDTVLVYTVDMTHEHQAHEVRQQARRLTDLLLSMSTRLVDASRDGLGAALDEGLAEIGALLGLNGCVLAALSEDGAALEVRHRWTDPEDLPDPDRYLLEAYPMLARVVEGQRVDWQQGRPLPKMASGADRLALDPAHTRAVLALPVQVQVQGRPPHALFFRHGLDPDGLSGWVSEGLEVLARLIGSALSRTVIEARLRRSEARLQGLVDTAPIGLLQIDRDGRLLAMNSVARLLLAVDDAALARLRAQFLLDPVVDAAGFDADLDPLARATGVMLGGERSLAALKAAMGLPVHPRDGDRWVVAHFMRVREPGVDEGALRLQEVSELRSLRERLQAAEARLAALEAR